MLLCSRVAAWLFILVTYTMYLHTRSAKNEIMVEFIFASADCLAKFAKMKSYKN